MHKNVPVWHAGMVPLPNALFDHLMPTLSDAELRVMLVMFRQTWGWREGSDSGGWRHKERDWISHSQLVQRTGRCSAAVSRAVASLVDKHLLRVEDLSGRALSTPAQRRRHLGRLYFRPGDKWFRVGIIQ